jgi:Leucine-rich repeat (LRR) protein
MNWNDDGSANDIIQQYVEGEPYYLGLHFKEDIIDENRELIQIEINKIKRRIPSFDADNIEYIKIYGGQYNTNFVEYEHVLQGLIKLGYSKLKGLSFERNHFSDSNFLNKINQFTMLEHLNLRTNELKTLPDSICSLPKLKNLNLSNNELIQLPDSIDRLTEIEILNLNNNKLFFLPRSLIYRNKFPNIKKLNLSYNEFNQQTRNISPTILEIIGGFENLESLNLSHNPITEVTFDFTDDGFDNLKELNMSNIRISELPINMFENATNLEKLNLSNNGNDFRNNLTTLPQSICNLNALTELKIEGNSRLQFVCNPQTENQYLSQYLTALEQERLRRAEQERLRRAEQQDQRNRQPTRAPPPNNLANEIHIDFNKLKFKKFDKKLIEKHNDWFPDTNIDIDPTDKHAAFKNLLKKTFTKIIEVDLKNQEQTKATADLNSIFANRLNLVDFQVSDDVLICCVHILQFLSHQPEEFKTLYVLSYLTSVTTAYDYPNNPLACLSCVNGMIERIISIFYDTCHVMSDFKGVFTGKNKAKMKALKMKALKIEYLEYSVSFEKNLPDLILGWIRTEWKEKHQNAENQPNLDERRELLLAYLLDPNRMPEDKTKEKYTSEIDEYIKHIEFFTDNEVMSYGGKRKTMKRKSKQRKTIKHKTRNRKTRKSNKHKHKKQLRL